MGKISIYLVMKTIMICLCLSNEHLQNAVKQIDYGLDVSMLAKNNPVRQNVILTTKRDIPFFGKYRLK